MFFFQEDKKYLTRGSCVPERIIIGTTIMVRAFQAVYFLLLMLIEAYPKKPNSGDLSLWIDEQQVKKYSGEYGAA